MIRGGSAPALGLNGLKYFFERAIRHHPSSRSPLIDYIAQIDEIDRIALIVKSLCFKKLSPSNCKSTNHRIATITEPDILIVDETLSVGDVFFQEKCEKRIQHFIDDGHVTVLFVSHAMDQVERICQRAVWIEKGDLRMDGPVDEVCKAYRAQFA